jgi:hypothetical protein
MDFGMRGGFNFSLMARRFNKAVEQPGLSIGLREKLEQRPFGEKII